MVQIFEIFITREKHNELNHMKLAMYPFGFHIEI